MYFLHLKCVYVNSAPKGLTIVDKEQRLWRSGNWDFKFEDAKKLIGGSIYLHETKTEPAYFGGEVRDVEQVEDTESSRSLRVAFVFEASNNAKGIQWRGAAHGMAWSSGICEESLL